MTYLWIDNGKAFFRNKQAQTICIDQISKDDLLFLLEEATREDANFEMMEPVDGAIQNAAHKIIYESLYAKMSELLKDRERFLDESNHLFEDAFHKYKNE